MPALPPPLLRAASRFDERQLTLVIGAGASRASPTNIPISRDLSLAAHAGLVRDGLLDAGECATPDDLSAVADAVYARWGRQRDLIDRIEREKLRSATPNAGYECAVALLLEGIVGCLLTLNFDLAATHALATVGAAGRISVVKGPREWGGATGSLILYLHRNVEDDPEALILRTAQIDTEWRAGWEAVAASAVLAAPVTAFVGLGTKAAVLVETIRQVKDSLPGATNVFLAGGRARKDSEYAGPLDIDDSHYIRLRWNEFMAELCTRTIEEYQGRLSAACAAVVSRNGWPTVDIASTMPRLHGGGIVEAGKNRSRWLLDTDPYTPLKDERATEQIADLVVVIARIEHVADVEHNMSAEGVVEFHSYRRLIGRAVLLSGRGTMRWNAFEARAMQRLDELRLSGDTASIVVHAGVTGPVLQSQTPSDIVVGEPGEDIATGEWSPTYFWADDIIADPRPALEAWQ